MAQKPKPPPLPPRSGSVASTFSSIDGDEAPPRYEDTYLSPAHSTENFPYSGGGGFDDPRSSSQHSLRPEDENGRRTLLIIYIHGFMGDETSFRSFPAHVHNVLTITLAESHVVHSKIYPRYASRKNISFARDDFSKWLADNESPTTDVILVGHSLGGILAAEVVLLPAKPGFPVPRHRIVGQIAYDTPFLGMHPGVISTGIASLFRPAPDQSSQESTPVMSPGGLERTSTNTSLSAFSDLSISPSDPNYNPAFPNDVHLSNRQGKWEKGWYFFNKHWGELAKASKNYVTSHLEFGGCMADYPGLKRRYDAIRLLEDIDDFAGPDSRPRVRFVNYYSASTGRIKERKPDPSSATSTGLSGEPFLQPPGRESGRTSPVSQSSASPRISLSEHRDGQIIQKDLEELNIDQPAPSTARSEGTSSPELAAIDPHPELDLSGDEATTGVPFEEETVEEGTKTDSLPDLPALPIPPIDFDPSTCHDPDTLKLRQKEHDRQVKAYERAIKDRNKTIRERQKLVEKRHKTEQKMKDKSTKEQLKRSLTLNPEAYDRQLQVEAKSVAPPVTIQKDRKFCTLPSNDKRTGRPDPTWVRVYMENMDEVVAHTSMFMMSEAYAKLVGDTAERIESWINQDATRRAVMEAQDLD